MLASCNAACVFACMQPVQECVLGTPAGSAAACSSSCLQVVVAVQAAGPCCAGLGWSWLQNVSVVQEGSCWPWCQCFCPLQCCCGSQPMQVVWLGLQVLLCCWGRWCCKHLHTAPLAASVVIYLAMTTLGVSCKSVLFLQQVLTYGSHE
jgi:hypothetical protein